MTGSNIILQLSGSNSTLKANSWEESYLNSYKDYLDHIFKQFGILTQYKAAFIISLWTQIKINKYILNIAIESIGNHLNIILNNQITQFIYLN